MDKRSKTDSIVVHWSASTFGDAELIRGWHKNKGWSDIGYHAVILNGCRTKGNYLKILDGKIEPGRDERMVGAHCEADGMNLRALGVCLIGSPEVNNYPSLRQVKALVHWLAVKCRRYGISPDRIYQHSDFDRGKPLCASLNMRQIRQWVKAELQA
jgi:hypothetical protein